VASGQWPVASSGRKTVVAVVRFAVLLATGHWTLATCSGAIFPDQIGEFTKSAPKALSVADQALYNEYGLLASEQAEYSKADQHFTATAWHMRDSTGALALFQARRPSGAVQDSPAQLAARTSDGVILAFGNYVFQFTGSLPKSDDLEQLYNQVPELEQAALPALPGFLPREGIIPNSERYLLGPVSLQRFEPRIAPSVAAFHLSAEGQLAKYQTPQGPLTLVLFEYPTPNMARERYQEFQNIPGAVAKRAGPLVGIIILRPNAAASERDASERILGGLRYEAKLTLNEKVPKDESKGFARLILNVFAASGILVALSILLGVAFGGFRAILKKIGLVRQDDEEMTVLRIGK
jgi:hypothetical protein